MTIKTITLVTFILTTLNSRDIETDSVLLDNYQSGRNRAMRIIETDHLTDSLMGVPYCVYIMGSSWIISARKSDGITIYYNNSKDECKQKLVFSKESNEITHLFSLLKIEHGNRIYLHNHYTPFYIYVAIFDCSHNNYFEWDSYTKFEKKNKKINSILRHFLSFIYRETDFFIL